MKQSLKWIFGLLIQYAVFMGMVSIGASEVSAQVFFEAPRIQKINYPCSEGGICEFEVTEQTYKVKFTEGGISWGTRMFAKYKTKEIHNLEDYAVVQFIKGCVFHSEQKEGQVFLYDNVKREFFDEVVTFRHRDFETDSVDTDPMYNNTPRGFEHWNTRHGLYRWNKKEGYEQASEVLFYKEKPTKNELYVVDRPGTAFFQGTTARNISLEFNTCVYRTKDVPLVGTPSDTKFAEPLGCLKWSSSFIYNFETLDFDRPKEIHPFCQKQF